MPFDPGEQCHLQLVGEALPLLVGGQSDEADDRDPGALAGRCGQQHARIDRGTGTAEQRVVHHRGGECLGQVQGEPARRAERADPLGQVGEEVHERVQPAAAVADEVGQGFPQYRLTALGLHGVAVHLRLRCERADRRVDGRGELVGVVAHRREVRQRLETQRPPRGAPRRPHDHVGRGEVPGGPLGIARTPLRGRFRPSVAEPGEVVVRVEDNRGHAVQGALLHEPADEHRLPGARSREDRGVLAERFERYRHGCAALRVATERDRCGVARFDTVGRFGNPRRFRNARRFGSGVGECLGQQAGTTRRLPCRQPHRQVRIAFGAHPVQRLEDGQVVLVDGEGTPAGLGQLPQRRARLGAV